MESLQPGEGPSRGLLRDCTTSPINRLQHWLMPMYGVLCTVYSTLLLTGDEFHNIPKPR